jgi:hypothetical protein
MWLDTILHTTANPKEPENRKPTTEDDRDDHALATILREATLITEEKEDKEEVKKDEHSKTDNPSD